MFRLIARLDIKGPNLIKPVRMEGLRVVGNPAEYAKRYSEQGADEILFIDTVATLYGRNQLASLLSETGEKTFVPIAVGGGIKCINDARKLFNAGADKIAVNTGALQRPGFIREMAEKFGCQAICVSIEAKRQGSSWEAYTDNGREKTGKDAIEWAHEAVERGAGELLITSVDREGTRQGFDLDILKALGWVSVPVIMSGGCGSPFHVKQAVDAGADAVAVADCLHYGRYSIADLRQNLGGRMVA